jgi:hypothetical protein
MIGHARDHYLQALEISRNVGEDGFSAEVLLSLGTIYCDLSKLEEA